MLDSQEVLAFSSCLLLVASPHVTKPWVHFFHQSDPKDCVSLGNDFVSAQRLSDISVPTSKLAQPWEHFYPFLYGRDTNPA